MNVQNSAKTPRVAAKKCRHKNVDEWISPGHASTCLGVDRQVLAKALMRESLDFRIVGPANNPRLILVRKSEALELLESAHNSTHSTPKKRGRA